LVSVVLSTHYLNLRTASVSRSKQEYKPFSLFW
jgi:hypothetical protein